MSNNKTKTVKDLINTLDYKLVYKSKTEFVSQLSEIKDVIDKIFPPLEYDVEELVEDMDGYTEYFFLIKNIKNGKTVKLRIANSGISSNNEDVYILRSKASLLDGVNRAMKILTAGKFIEALNKIDEIRSQFSNYYQKP